MPLKKDSLDKQLERARGHLAARAKLLGERGVTGKDRRRDTEWRRLSAVCATIESRLKAFSAVRNLDDELKQRKADKASGKSAEAAPKAQKKGKKEQKPPKEKSKKKSN